MDKVEESIAEEEASLGILKFVGWVLFLLMVVFAAGTLYGVANGKNLSDSVPCGRSCIVAIYSCFVHKMVEIVV